MPVSGRLFNGRPLIAAALSLVLLRPLMADDEQGASARDLIPSLTELNRLYPDSDRCADAIPVLD